MTTPDQTTGDDSLFEDVGPVTDASAAGPTDYSSAHGERAKRLRVSARLVAFPAPRVGLEPTTLRLTAECSAN